MRSVTNLMNQPVQQPVQHPVVVQSVPSNIRQINFKAGEVDQFLRSQSGDNKGRPSAVPRRMSQQDMMAQMMMERQKEQKKAKRKQNWMTALQVLGVVSGIALAGAVVWNMFFANKGKVDLVVQDVSKEKSFADMVLSDELKDIIEDLKIKISRAASLKEKGSVGNNGILLYGKPGGGKNAFVYALTKFFQEKFPGSELVMVDVNKFKGMYNGQTENNILEFIEALKKKALENPNRKLIVFLDEFDSIARKAGGANSESMESFQNAFKTTLSKLMEIENVQVIAATNKAEKGVPIEEFLDSAISNRFAEKIHIPLPTAEQLKDSFLKYFKKLPAKFVDPKLLNADTKFWDKVCEYIAEESHNASYRDFNYILEHVRLFSEKASRAVGSPITMQDLIDGIVKHSKNSNWDEIATENFKKAITQMLT